MARSVRKPQVVSSPLRRALADHRVEHLGKWGRGADPEQDRFVVACREGQPMVLDAATLHWAMFSLGDPRERQFRHDSQNDPRGARRWLLTEADELLGPLTDAQLAELGA